MAGALVLVFAVFGISVNGRADVDLTTDSQRVVPAAHSEDGSDAISNGDIDISRDFDRGALEKQVEAQARQRQGALKQLDERAKARGDQVQRQQERRRAQAERLRDQWVLPVAGYRLTARFGQSSSLWSSGSHTGLDFAGPSGSKISSVTAGTVKSAGYEGSYGNRTVVAAPDGTELWYCHQSSMAVQPGDKVEPGQTIGATGSTGNVTGPHLHVEVHKSGGGAVDPEQALIENGARP